MHCYKINGLSITATSKEEAELVARETHVGDKDSILFVYEDGTAQRIILKEQKCIVFSQTKNSVVHVGTLVSGTGQQIIQAAVRNIDNSAEQSKKIRANTKKVNRLAKESEYDDIITAFRERVPEKALVLFDAMMHDLCGANKLYRIEVCQEIDANVKVNPENWFRMLQWFRSTVLEGDGAPTQFAKRKAFVTTVCKMGAEEYRASNAVQGVIDNDKDFWAKYTDKDG